MTLKPCATCGEPAPATYCDEHRPVDTRAKVRTAGHVHTNTAAWKRLSKRLRRMSPFCEFCGATEALSVDHIIPVSERPELAYEVANCRVLCLVCNGRRASKVTAAERAEVEARLTRGDTPAGHDFRPLGKAKFESEIG